MCACVCVCFRHFLHSGARGRPYVRAIYSFVFGGSLSFPLSDSARLIFSNGPFAAVFHAYLASPRSWSRGCMRTSFSLGNGLQGCSPVALCLAPLFFFFYCWEPVLPPSPQKKRHKTEQYRRVIRGARAQHLCPELAGFPGLFFLSLQQEPFPPLRQRNITLRLNGLPQWLHRRTPPPHPCSLATTAPLPSTSM